MRAAPAATGFQDTYPNPSEAAFQAALVALLNALKDHGESPELDLASAATCDVGGQNTNRLRITGTGTTITSLGSNYRGAVLLRFAGACPITHNATSLICPAGASFTTAAGEAYMAYPKATAGVSDGWVLAALPGGTPLAAKFGGTGRVLTGPPGSVLLYDSGALSGVANHAITSVISSAFRTYELEITDFKLATAGGDLQLQVSANNGSSYLAGASDYSHMRVSGTTAGGSPGLTVSGGDIKWVLAAGLGNSASFPAHSVVRLRAQGGVGSLRASMHHKTLVYTGSDAADLSGSGYVNTLNFDAIRIQPSAGNFDGRIRLIGIA